MALLDLLTTPLTRQEAEASIYDGLAAIGLETTTWKAGSPTRAIITAVSIVISALSQLQVLTTKSGFLALSEGAWLTLVAKEVYDVDRDEGSFATGIVNVSNSSGFVYELEPGDLVVAKGTQTYRNTALVTIGAGAVDVAVAVQADEIGSASSAGPGEIDTLVTSFIGVTVDNPGSLLGNDAEDDFSLRTRCQAKIGTLSPMGARDAYSFVARTAKRSNGQSIGVTRVKLIPDGFGLVDVFVATASGAVTGTAGDPETDLGAINKAIQEQVVPHAVTAVVQSATALAVDVTYELWIRDTTGLTDEEIEEAIEVQLAAFFGQIAIGGHLVPPTAGRVYFSAIVAAIAGAFPNEVIKVAVTTPVGDVVVDVDEAPKIGTPTATAIHQLAGDIL